MKKCTVGWFSKIVSFLVILFFFLPLTGISLYLAFFSPQTASDERLLFVAEALIFGGLVVFAAYRAVYLGLMWVEYDAEIVIFHYSRKETYTFRWSEIPGERIQMGRENGGYIFCIQENGRRRNIPLNRLSRGCRDFEKTLAQTGVLERCGIWTQEAFRQNAEQILEQFQTYRSFHPDSVKPKPEGACVACPDCGGTGARLKNLPLVHIQVAKVCKTCGGSGYVPK